MDDPRSEIFQALNSSRRELSEDLSKLFKRIPSLLAEKRKLNVEIQSLIRKIRDLKKEKQRPLSEGGKCKIEDEFQHLKYEMELLQDEAGDIDKVLNEYSNYQQALWKEINEVWEKQCEIWDEINPSKIPNADE